MSAAETAVDPAADRDIETRARPWAASAEAVLATLGTDAAVGLPEAEVRRRLGAYGPNRLRRMEVRSGWRILWDQLASLIVALLVAGATIALLFGERIEGGAIVAVIVLNTTIGFVTERRAVRSMEALRELGQADSTVRREGRVRRVPASELVVGDVVVLDAGDVLTADLRLISGSRLQADESPLTGESLPVDKDPGDLPAETSIAERACMLFKGTALTRGAGEGVVVATGMETELGRISSLVESAEPETTPLEQRLDRLARRLIGLTLVIAAAVAVVVAASGRDLVFAVEIAIALAVATIPEGLPIVATVALARGMWRMVGSNALVERLAAVETLGSTTVILTDKTGTLTENRMTVVELRLAVGRFEVGGTGLDLTGAFLQSGEAVDPTSEASLREAIRIGVLCNDATLHPRPGQEPEVTGDPTEVALLVLGAKAGLERGALLGEWPERREIAFDPDTKRMATIHDGPRGLEAAVKGAPEAIVELCDTALGPGDEAVALDAEGRRAWLAEADAMAAGGQRVLAVAKGTCASVEGFDFTGLTLVALVGFFDPPRERVRGAIDACRDAGIRVVMVTGDHGATAASVAEAIGLVDRSADGPVSVVDGRSIVALQQMTPADVEALLDARVIARASPRQKLDLIALHQRHGAVVAMTGDGVNDAPALKKADIGVAMGLRGTQVAREAADMVLRDDELGTIVMAVGQGRAIFANIRKFVVYLMSCNVSEIFVVGLGVATTGPMPILPLQILFLNLVTDVFPALALGVGEGSPALMRQPPRDPQEPVLTPRLWRSIFVLGGLIAVSVIGSLLTAWRLCGLPESQVTTVAFLTLAMAQLWHAFSMRNPGSRWLANEVVLNPWLWGAIALCLALLVLAVHVPLVATALSLSPPGPVGWAIATGFSLLPLLIGQLLLLPGPRRLLFGEAWADARSREPGA